MTFFWLNMFVERSFKTIKEEYLNLEWIGDQKKLLDDTKYRYNRREQSVFGYRTSLKVTNNRFGLDWVLPKTAGG